MSTPKTGFSHFCEEVFSVAPERGDKMKRIEIIDVIGKDYLTSNIENEELSYQKALKEIGKDIADYQKDDYKSIIS